MPPEELPEETNEVAEEAPPGWRARLLVLPRRLWRWTVSRKLNMAISALGLIALLGGLSVTWLIVFPPRSPDDELTLEDALEALDTGDYPEAIRVANVLRRRKSLPIEEWGGPLFVLGMATYEEAKESWSSDKEKQYLLASRYLEEARDRGFPEGRDAEGLYTLGKTLFLSGQIPASRSALRAALEAGQAPRKTLECYWLLASAYLRDANPKYPEALQYNRRYLAQERLKPEQRNLALAQRAEILLGMGKIDECVTTLNEIPSTAKNIAEATILRGQVILHKARQLAARSGDGGGTAAREQYESAIEMFRRASGKGTIENAAARQAAYLIGVCYLEMGDYRAALKQFERTHRLYENTPEAQAANFHEAELLRKAGRNDEALAGYRRLLGGIRTARNYSNPWIPLDKLRRRITAAYQNYLATKNFQRALDLARLTHPLFSKVRSLELVAEAYRTWGRSLVAQSEQLPQEEAGPLATKGRELLRLAGREWEHLARIRVADREYPDDLWNSAICYLEGRDYRGAAELMHKYLKTESRRRHPRALVGMGEAMLSLGYIDRALAALNECIEFYPRDAAAFRARLLASYAYMEKNQPEQAELLLQDNISGDFLTPASKEWRESLFALGQLLHTIGDYSRAIERLEEAVARYPDNPQALKARYLAADSYRQFARSSREQLQQNVVETARATHGKQIRKAYLAALELCEEIQEQLSQRQETRELTAEQKLMLRNSYFFAGSTLFELGRYEEAVKMYSTATNRYQSSPAVLDAYLQIANAYRRMNKPVEARGTIEQAKAVLARIDPDADFKKSTVRTRKQWKEYLDWMAAL
jgi:tetratricopeptide (TPR) repeat protein